VRNRDEVGNESSVVPDVQWWDRWIAEAERRYERLESGDDPGLSEQEFWSDSD